MIISYSEIFLLSLTSHSVHVFHDQEHQSAPWLISACTFNVLRNIFLQYGNVWHYCKIIQCQGWTRDFQIEGACAKDYLNTALIPRHEARSPLLRLGSRSPFEGSGSFKSLTALSCYLNHNYFEAFWYKTGTKSLLKFRGARAPVAPPLDPPLNAVYVFVRLSITYILA